MTACNNEEKTSIATITSTEAKEALENDDSIIVLDVRTIEEFNQGRIPNSLLIPIDELEDIVGMVILKKDTRIFIYCRSGNRSRLAAETLINLGYTNVYDLGGIIDWPYELIYE